MNLGKLKISEVIPKCTKFDDLASNALKKNQDMLNKLWDSDSIERW